MFQMETVASPLYAQTKQPDVSITRETIFIAPKVEININFSNAIEEEMRDKIKNELVEVDEDVQRLTKKNVVSICVEPDINLENRLEPEPDVSSEEFIDYAKCVTVKKKHKRKTSSPRPLRNWIHAPPYCTEMFTTLPDDYLNNCYRQLDAQSCNDEMDTYTLINENHTYKDAELNGAPQCNIKDDTQKQIKATFGCSYCNYRANDRSTLAKHINAKHTKTVVFNCSYCNYKTYQKGHLSNHINAKHTKDSCFACPYCAYATYHKSNLNKHVNSRHTRVTQYSCSYCSYKAYRKGHLSQHVNAKHTESTVFNCSYCSYKAYQKGNLSRHVEAKHGVAKNGD